MKTRLLSAISLLALTAFTSQSTHAHGHGSDNEPLSAVAKACVSLERNSYERTADSPAVITNAQYVTDAKKSLKSQFMFGKRSIVQGMPVGENIKELPAHCRLEGYFAPAVKFLILLPEKDDWNDDVIYTACDAFCGAVEEDMPVPGLVKGFATIATDGGHINKRPFDGTWGYNNRQGEIDFGYRASHLASQLIKKISFDYYGKNHEHSYITGFSKGGLAGVKSALTYPKDFDGILARAPVLRYQEINSIKMPWLYSANTREDGSPILLAEDTKIIHKAAIENCDDKDGLKDGIIGKPMACEFDPAVLLCKVGQKEDCLTQEQVDTTRKFYELPKNKDGKVAYPYPLPVGSEKDWYGFHAPVSKDAVRYSETISSSYLRYMAFEQDPGPFYDWQSFDPVAEADKLDALKSIYDANDPDLTAFRDSGGKMIIIHGLADGAVNSRMTTDWFDKVLEVMGETTSSFVQLYAVPGNQHGGSPTDGPHINESLAALQSWVEKNIAPKKLVFTRKDKDEKVTHSRPHFPYPSETNYSGKGSISNAKNFSRQAKK
ncbi:MAG: tannase/feruloyl esterase family alpha/beta hydrolase [Kangiellaceae bacterium]|nr:tannase/feruloyl esterase family alpha/beta hydrolase [Kangiellaceae bacterium]